MCVSPRGPDFAPLANCVCPHLSPRVPRMIAPHRRTPPKKMLRPIKVLHVARAIMLRFMKARPSGRSGKSGGSR